MRLLTLRIHNFRGFGPAVAPIRIDSDLLLFYGPNGFGKTSVAEAIEWLFYGTTKRRQRGDNYSRSEYAGSFANAHGGQPTEVEALVRHNGVEVRICRRLMSDELSETLIDGVVSPFSTLNISPVEAVYPVVAQHGLQTFIHSKPKDRRDAICAALGLDELTALKTALDSARTSFQRTPPRTVTEARRELAQNIQVLASLPQLATLVVRWRSDPLRVDVTNDIADLLMAAESLTGATCPTVQDALTALRSRRIVASRAVFDANNITPNDEVAAHALVESAGSAVAEDLGRVERAIAAAVAAMASTYAAALLEFWSKGLELAPSGAICPMCEANTLDEARRREIRRRLSGATEALASSRTLTDSITRAKASLAQIQDAIVHLGAPTLREDDQTVLSSLFVDQADVLAAFLDSHRNFDEARQAMGNRVAAASAILDSCAGRLSDPANAPSVVSDMTRAKDEIAQSVAELMREFRAYLAQWPTFERLLSSRIASTDLVARIDAVGKSLRNESHMRVLERYEAALNVSRDLIRTVEAQIQAKQSALLTTRGAEVKDLYDRLNRGANVGFQEMEPGTDNMKLHATSFGVRMSAAANLSECQLNCVGLAMWLMRATTPTSPFGFVLLDDPVQSMDDDHTEAFISDIVPHLLDDHGKQVIVLSHVKRITERLRELNQNRQTKLFHFDSYDRGGPVITEQIRLRMLLAEIKGAARGNAANREYAVDRIRVFVEQFIRELHLNVMGQPAPPCYDNATAAKLLPLFQTITGTTPQEHVGLRDTVRFSDPAHHTQVGYSVPLATNIQPHVDRLENLLNKYGL